MHRLRWKDVERRCWRSHSQILCHIRFIDIYMSHVMYVEMVWLCIYNM